MRKRNPIARARWRYIISYILASMLPLLLCAGFILMVNVQNNRKQVEQTTVAKLDLVKTQMDLVFKNLESAAMHFASSDAFSSADDAAISAQLRTYRDTYPYIEEAVFLRIGDSRIITSQQEMHYATFRDGLKEHVDLDLSSFFSRMNQASGIALRPTYLHSTREADGDMVIYIQPVPYLATRSEGSIAFFLRHQTIYDVFEDGFGSDAGYFYVLDQNMTILYASDRGLQVDSLRSRMNRLRGTGLFTETVDGMEFVLLRSISDTLGAYYMAAIPADLFYADVRMVMDNQIFVLIAAIVAVSLIAALLALAFYRPIERLLRDIAPEQTGGHMQMLRGAGQHVQRIAADRDALSLRVDRQHEVLLRQLVIGLLQGQLQEIGLSLLLEQLHLSWQGDRFLALHVWLTQPAAESDPVAAWPLEDGTAYLIPIDQAGQIGVLVDMKRREGEAGDAQRLRIAQALQSRLLDNGLIPQRIGVGGMRSECMEAASSSLEAQSMHQGTGAEQEGVIALYKETSHSNLSESFLPIAEKGLLCQCLISGNEQLATQTIERLQKNLRTFAGNRVMMRSIFFYLYDAMVTTAEGMRLSVSRKALDRSIEASSLDQFMDAMGQYCREACAQVTLRKAQSTTYTQHSILQYVQTHFTEYTLSMDELCTQFDLSASYLTRFFKQETGYSFLQYVSMLRMHRIKAQLSQTDLPIKEIVQQCGYIDIASFTRKFRQIEGMTPGEYRERHAGSKNGLTE